MRWEDIQMRWDELDDRACARWRELTREDIQRVEGDRTRLALLIRERLGLTASDAEISIELWASELSFEGSIDEEAELAETEPIDEAARHPGRDDVHEQREDDQEAEGIVHWPPHLARARPPRRPPAR